MNNKFIIGIVLLLVLFVSGCSDPVDIPVDNTPDQIYDTAGETVEIVEPIEVVEDGDYTEEEGFYIITFTQPIFFTPTDEPLEFKEEYNFNEQNFITTLETLYDMDINVYPEEFHSDYEKTQQFTLEYYTNPTENNARKLIKQQKQTVLSYSKNLNDFLNVFAADVEFGYTMANNQEFNLKTMVETFDSFNKNAEAMSKEINHREKILNGEISYSLPEMRKPGLREFEVFSTQNVISMDTAEDLFSLTLRDANDINDGIIDDLILYKVNNRCWNKPTTYVYGTHKKTYANIIDAERDIIYNIQQVGDHWLNPYTGCMCPYGDVTSLNWYLVDDMVSKISEESIQSVKEYEDMFLENPTQYNLELLSQAYRYELYERLKNESKDDIDILWKRTNQIDSKVHVYSMVMDDINMTKHFINLHPEEHIDKGVISVVPLNSYFPLTFMPWSSSAWFLDKPLVFDDGVSYEERETKYPMVLNFTIDDIDNVIKEAIVNE